MQNATYLFSQPTEGFHHSESRWNAICQLAFEWMGNKGVTLDVYHSTYENKASSPEWLKKDTEISFKGMNSVNTVVEGGLNHTVFGLSETAWNKDFNNISPDIVHISKEQIICIEVKTIGASVKENICLYRRLTNHLKESIPEKNVEFYYLLSYGHNPNSDWKYLSYKYNPKTDCKSPEDGANILLWEDMFSKIQDSELAPYIHPDLKKYTLKPDWL